MFDRREEGIKAWELCYDNGREGINCNVTYIWEIFNLLGYIYTNARSLEFTESTRPTTPSICLLYVIKANHP